MPLQLQKGNETDLDRIYTIQTAAFAEDDLGQILFPGEITEDAKTRAIERARKDMRDPDITYMLAVDTDLDSQIVGFGKWHIYKHERPESEWKKVQKRDWGEGANVAAADEFFGAIQEKRARIIGGAAHCLLGLLDIHPDHQRRGAGKMLVEWGTNVADEAGLFCYLEGSPAGYSLYKKCGFEDVEYLDTNLTKWGGEIAYRHVCMIRPAKKG